MALSPRQSKHYPNARLFKTYNYQLLRAPIDSQSRSEAANGKKDDPKRDVPAAKAVKKPSKKKREDWYKIEVEVGDSWDSLKEGFKAKMAAAKGTSGKNRKADPYGPLYVAAIAA